MMPRKIDVVGRVFGRLTVLCDKTVKSGERRRVSCKCECGNVTSVDPRLLLQGDTKSCGCLQKEVVSKIASERISHGMSKTPEYNRWNKMKSRCHNPKDQKYKDYGGRGITICERWAWSFENFYTDMGPLKRVNDSIERLDVDGNYEPSNCVWATPIEQARNKRNHRMVSHNGREMPLSEACELTGVKYQSALYRLNMGKNWKPLDKPPIAACEGE
jgi:hypothetical protein